MRRSSLVSAVSPLLLAAILSHAAAAASLTGIVTLKAGGTIAGARVTVASTDVSFFRETRTDGAGQYAISAVPPGTYELGASALGREYEHVTISVGATDIVRNFTLGPDVHPGRWTVIGDTDPENLYASNSGTLMPDGRIFYCHDTEEPVVFDPRTGQKSFPPSSPSHQGCHISTVLANRRLIFIGGQDSDDFRDATRMVKSYNPANSGWAVLTPMFEERWYPGMARLADGRLLVMGGGQRPNAQRTPTCEIYDPLNGEWMLTGSMSQPSDYPPAVLLFNGEVLRSWFPPQLYNTKTGEWRDTGELAQPNRFWPGHSDHSLVLLADGRAMLCGIYRGNLASPSMVELYEPASGMWTLGASTEVTRSQPEVVMLPTGTVLCAGGKLEDVNPSVPTNQWGQTKLADLYDPMTNSWRPLANMVHFREYHAVSVLVPDGRVVVTAGTGGPAQPGISNDVEALEPPYLFRGVRPRIDALSTADLRHDQPFTLEVSRTNAVTSVVLIGTNAVTHWVDGGVPRILALPFIQKDSTVEATMPDDPVMAPVGTYILFALVDDIPSEGIVVAVGAQGTSSVDDAPPVKVIIQVAPNPFRHSALISWYQVTPGPAHLGIYDVKGRLVAERELSHAGLGWRRLQWDGTNGNGRLASSGVYWLRLETAGEGVVRKVALSR